MDVYAHEKEQIDSIKAWWRENRWYIIAGLVISAAVVGGWRYWQEYQKEQAEAASQQYAQLLTRASVGDTAGVENIAAALRENYAGTPYAVLGTLKLAAARVDAGKYALAADDLRWAMNNTDDDELGLVARGRLARVMLQQGQAADVLALLEGVAPGKFEAIFAELRGDALLANGDRAAARIQYEAALAAMQPGLGDRRLVQMKLDNLAMPLSALVPESATAPESTAAGDAGETGDDSGNEESGK